MTALVCLAFLAFGPDGSDDLEEAQRELEAGRWGRAAELLADQPAGPEVERLWTELYYRAGAPALALDHAERGLELAPGSLELLHRAVSCALWLAAPEQARSLLERLVGAVAAADLAPDHRQAWEASIEDYRRRLSALEARERARSRALRRARSTALMGLAGGCVGLWWLARGQGRSSRPL